MACLINSIDELPKIVEMDWPITEEGWTEFAQNYVCVANGQEVPFDSVAFDSDTAVLYYSTILGGDDLIEITITSGGGDDPKGLKKSAENETISAVGNGIFDPLTSLTLCEKSSGGKTICGVPVCDDGKEPIVIVPTAYPLGKEYVGTSKIDKPMNVQQYSIYHELDTGKNYYYDNGEWNEIPCCSGGGSSDFSTATVTSINNTGAALRCVMPLAFDDVGDWSSSSGQAYFDIGTTTTTAILYKGKCNIYMPSNEYTITISGNIEDDSDGYYIITGDCTITISE